MKYILAYNKEDLLFNGFYVEGTSKNVPSPNISIDRELWSYLASINSFKLKADFEEKEVYTIEDKDLFEEVIISVDDTNVSQEPTLDTRVSDLEKENADLLLASVQHETKINSVEQDLADLMLTIATMMEV